MKRDLYIDRRLQHWAAWRLIGTTGRYNGIEFEYSEGRACSSWCYSDTADDEIRGLEMDRAIASLPAELSKTVVAVYTWEGGLEKVIRDFKVTRATIHRRLCHADIRLLDYLGGDSYTYSAGHDKNNYESYTK